MTSKTHVTYRHVKGSILKDGILNECGYILGDFKDENTKKVIYKLVIVDTKGFSFFFGFQGLGCHYRVDIDPEKNVIAIYQLRDGIPVYLHHVITRIGSGSTIEIDWDINAIGLRLNKFTVLQVLADGSHYGHWGFAPRGSSFRLPEIEIVHSLPSRYQWICLGDGFSNARWRNRSFLSWPELVFGGTDSSYLNACVGAGNTRRVLEVIEFLSDRIAGTDVFVATGSDDLIECENLQQCMIRIREIIAELKNKGAARIYLCSLPPRLSAMSQINQWNEKIFQIANETGVNFLNFYDWLLLGFDKNMVYGEYPGAKAQTVIANHVSDILKIQSSLPPPTTFDAGQSPSCLMRKVLQKSNAYLEKWTLDFPGLLR